LLNLFLGYCMVPSIARQTCLSFWDWFGGVVRKQVEKCLNRHPRNLGKTQEHIGDLFDSASIHDDSEMILCCGCNISDPYNRFCWVLLAFSVYAA
jgi:hypothetical protein